jgi:hypothetical protein
MSSSTSSSLVATVNGFPASESRSKPRRGRVPPFPQSRSRPSFPPQQPSMPSCAKDWSRLSYEAAASHELRSMQSPPRRLVNPPYPRNALSPTTKTTNQSFPSPSGPPPYTPAASRNEDSTHVHDGIERAESERFLNPMEVGDFLLRRRTDGSLALSLRATEGLMSNTLYEQSQCEY